MPKIVFMENVRNFAFHDKGYTLEVVKNTMEELGYSFNYKILNAADFGIPQKRERVYMVAFRGDLGVKDFSFPEPIKLERHLEDLLITNEEVVEHLYTTREDVYMNGRQDTTYSNKPIRLGVVNKGGQGERIYSVKGVGITLSAYGGGAFSKTGGYMVNGRARRLHPRECARMMGFPDWYEMDTSPYNAYRQFGNSVVVDVLQYIGINIGNSLAGSAPGE